MTRYYLRLTLAALLLCSAVGSMAAPLETTFTYQGELTVSGQPASGQFDLRFELYDADSGGAQAGGTIIVEDVVVSSGIFTTELDFGAGPFAGDQLWIEVSVRNGNETGGFTELLPRQKLTAAPYALHAEMVAPNAIGSAEIVNGSISAGDINANQVQRRVAGACTTGSFVRAVNADGSVTCGDDGPGAPQDQLLTIGATAFTPRESSLEYSKGLGNGGAYITGGSGTFAALIAPVQLPDGATVTQVRAIYQDNSASENLRLVFGLEFSAGGFFFLDDIDTSGQSTTRQEITVSNREIAINNDGNSYYVMAINSNWPTARFDLRIAAFEIAYRE